MSAALALTATVALGPPLALDDVLRSVEVHHPLVLASRRDVDAARGGRLEAEGAFDTYLSAKGGGYPLGYYDGVYGSIEARQPTTLWGTELFAGYRYGADHPIYDADKLTSENGEWVAGLMVPLWRDGPTDARRTRLKQADIDVELASLDVHAKLLALKSKAAAVYFKWVASHEKLRIAESLHELALQRASGIEERVRRGDIPRLELIDNRRLITSREQGVVEARREVQASAYALSLFLRDADGRPVVPRFSTAPGDLETPNHRSPPDATDVKDAIRRRPDVARFDALRTRLEADLALAENDRAPRVDLGVVGSRDIGATRAYGPDPGETTKNDTTLSLSLSLAWPVQQRKARGKAQATSAKLRAVAAKRAFLVDQVEVEIQDAWSALDAARRRVQLAKETLELTQIVEQGERRRFELGASSILQVNLREEATAKSAKDLVDALADAQRAEAWYRAVTANL